jgi:hypothetical protein
MGTQNAAEMLALFRPSLKKVEFGDEMLSLIEKLIAERDELLERQEHINSMERLVKKTVSDADELAAQIKREAEVDALSRSKEIVKQAEEQAQRILEEARATALAHVDEEILAKRSAAEEELLATLKEQRESLGVHLKALSEGLYQQMLTHAEDSRQLLEVAQKRLQENLFRVPSPAQEAAAPVEGEDAAMIKTTPKGETAGPDSEFEQLVSLGPTAQAPEPGVALGVIDEPGELVEVEILQPRDKDSMEHIRRYLELQEEVGSASICHLTDKTSIQVRLLRPLDVEEMVSGLSEVEQAQTVTDKGSTKIQVLLSAHAELERQREAINVKANRIAARIGRSKFR